MAILIGYWAAFALYPLPPSDFDYQKVGVPADWPYHYSGFTAHWNKNSNLAWAFDTWILNLFPRPKPFRLRIHLPSRVPTRRFPKSLRGSTRSAFRAGSSLIR